MALDPLAISSGSNRGEAAFLGESSFDPVQLAYRAAQDMKTNRERTRKEQLDNLTLLDDKIKTTWDADTFNYFQPKLASYKQSVIDAFKQTNGQLTPIQKMQFKSQLDELTNEADVNNALWKDYQDQVKLLDKDTEGKYDRNASAQLLNVWRNPYNNPEAKADIQQNYGGNINKWRAANAERFRLIPSFSMDKFVGDISKDEKAATYAVKDEKGNIVYGKHPTGEKFYEEETKLTPQQLNTVNNRIWSESNYQADKAKERARQEVDKIFSINDVGHIGFSSDLGPQDKAAAKYMIEKAGDLRGLKPEEVKERLARGYTALQIDAKTNQGKKMRDIGFAPQSSGGSGKSFTDKFTVTTSPYSTGGGAEDFNKKYPGAKLDPKKQSRAVHKGDNVRTVAIEPNSKGGDTESFMVSISGKPMKPIEYVVDDNTGEAWGLFSEKVQKVEKDILGNVKKVIEEDQIHEYPLDDKIITNVAAQYGFGGSNGVARFKKEALGLNEKQASKKRRSAKQYGL